MASRFVLPHIDIARLSTSHAYLGASGGSGGNPRGRQEHGRRVQNELAAALALADQYRPIDDRLDPPTGAFIEVDLRAGTKPDALDQKTQGIRSGAAKADDRNDRTIALFIPDASRAVFQQILDDYLNGPLTEKGRNPPHQAKVEAIEAFRAAKLETFWTDDPRALPDDPQHQMWWALWCWAGSEATIDDVCSRLRVPAAGRDRRLYFPEIVVVPVFASRATIELMLFATGAIAELRRASDSPYFFTDEVRGEQRPWVEDLAERTRWPPNDAPAVCLLDTGVNRGHSLIEPALAANDMHALDRAWGSDDHDDGGHGTAMAGLALHGDLTAALVDRSDRRLTHRLESVTFLPPQGFDPTQPHSYGIVTQAAIALPEIAAPDRARVYCMAVTNEDVSGATPSAWSAAIDQAANGSMIGDEAGAPKRLIVVSGGNVPPHIEMARIRPQDEYPIEDPAQAWNALTVGGYTDHNTIQEQGYENWSAMADTGDVSPHSRTSASWRQNAPFKPEIVMEAGNRAINPTRTEALTMASLSLLSTGRDAGAPLVPFEATSAAAAQAARLAARLRADHPDYWAETIRALMIHSAEWTGPMLAKLGARPSKRERYELIRRFGYGVPDFERATASASNHLALFAQSEIQPFRMDGGRKFGDCHYYTLPMPRRMLEDLENEIVELKVTLSYFIDPNPGLSASVDPQRYQSHGLRFDLRRKNEDLNVFKQRVNASERDNPRVGPQGEADDTRWLLGPQSVASGSLHCDVWTGPAIELAGRDTLCIKPVVGWCRSRAAREVCNATRRYSLIVSLKAHNIDVDLYTPVSAAVDVLLGVPVRV
ncbi:hypothetical protein STVA_48910 [Allostella vacuolata]|nr:hypothetical protein STVA_48910 [Stella vacuolata]